MIRHVALLPIVLLAGVGCGPPDDATAAAVHGLEVDATAPVLHLPFSEPDGERALDRSGFAHHGTVHGAERVRDVLGRALRFDGSNDYVRVPERQRLNVRGAMTLSAWVKTTDPMSGAAPTQREILFRGEANIVFGFEKEAVDGITWLRCYLRQSLDPLVYREVAVNDDGRRVRDGRWHHLVVVFNPGEDMRLYIDGDEAARRATHMRRLNLSAVSNHYSVGARLRMDGSVDRELRGLVDDVRIYDRALDGRAVERLYRTRVGD